MIQCCVKMTVSWKMIQCCVKMTVSEKREIYKLPQEQRKYCKYVITYVTQNGTYNYNYSYNYPDCYSDIHVPQNHGKSVQLGV